MLGMEIKLNKERIAEKESYSYEVYIATLDKLFKERLRAYVWIKHRASIY